MRIAAVVFGLLLLVSNASHGQIRAKEVGSAEGNAALEKYREGKPTATPSGVLSVFGLKVGAEGYPAFIDAKVMQVIDAKSMLVGLDDSRNGDGRYGTLVMVKCNTSGVVDGAFFRMTSGWEEVAGSDYWKVTGTTTYKTVLGTKTVFVLEAVEHKKPIQLTEAESKALSSAEKRAQGGKAKAKARARVMEKIFSDREKNAKATEKELQVEVKKEAKSVEAVDKSVKASPSKASPPSSLLGRWKIINDKGVIAAYFTLSDDFQASKAHAPKVAGKWQVVGKDVKITWSDGFIDVIRPTGKGDKMLLVETRSTGKRT
jgi:hypothetical protein